MCDSHDQGEHEMNWTHQNQLREQWIVDHPEAEYEGWMSI
jgi:hypothetical protein